MLRTFAWCCTAEEVDKLEVRGNDAASRLHPGGSAEDAAAREAWGQLRTIRQLLQADARCDAGHRFRVWGRGRGRAEKLWTITCQTLQAGAPCDALHVPVVHAGRAECCWA